MNNPVDRLDRIEEDGLAWRFTATRAKTRAMWLGIFSLIASSGLVALFAYVLSPSSVDYAAITFVSLAAGATVGGALAAVLYYIETEKNHV